LAATGSGSTHSRTRQGMCESRLRCAAANFFVASNGLFFEKRDMTKRERDDCATNSAEEEQDGQLHPLPRVLGLMCFLRFQAGQRGNPERQMYDMFPDIAISQFTVGTCSAFVFACALVAGEPSAAASLYTMMAVRCPCNRGILEGEPYICGACEDDLYPPEAPR
jgi:hypothetical protein